MLYSLMPHRIIPERPSLVGIAADVGAGKTTLLIGTAAAMAKAGKRVLYIYGEGHPHNYEDVFKAAGGVRSLITFVDGVVEHTSVQLENMLEHPAIKPHVATADCIIIDPMVKFESLGIRPYKQRQRLGPLLDLVRKGATVYTTFHTNSERSIKKPLDLFPRGWPGSFEVCLQLYPTDANGHFVLEMTRGRHYQPPLPAWDFWIAKDENGTPIAVIGGSAEKRIADLMLEKRPNYLPHS
jgi:hypothetical protein